MQYQLLFSNVEPFRETKNGISFSVKIKADAKINALKEYVIVNDTVVFKISLKAPAIKGKANKELIEFLAELLKVSKTAITIKGGLTDKNKLIEVAKPYDEKAKKSLNEIINK